MKIQLNKAHFPVTTLGVGRRIGLWFQGCSIRCPGCLSRDTWERDACKDIDCDALLALCRVLGKDGFDGITISGGEPFEQAEGLHALLDGLVQWRKELRARFDILCYSGMSLATLRASYGDVLGLADAVIPEPFIKELPNGGVWRGSSNQPLVPLTSLGRERYVPFLDAESDGKSRFQVAVIGGQIWYIGIPDRGDLDALSKRLVDQGVEQSGVSWHA